MNPSDTETSSSSTSSSSAGPGDCVTPTRRPPTRGEERSSVERARGASAPPSYLREAGSGGASRYDEVLEPGSQRETSQGTGGDAGGITTRMLPASPACRHPKKSSITGPGPSQRNNEEMAVGTTPSRQRPLSAPPKAYQFSRDFELSQEHDSPGTAGCREVTTVVRARRGSTDDLSPKEAGRLRRSGESEERAVGGRGGQALGGSTECRTVHERLSLSSIFGAASERRPSEERRPSIRNSRLLDGTDRNASSNGAAQPDLREKSENAGGAKKVNSATVGALSSRDFGLHQWKEYAVLRHGNNRRFVKSQHGREILAETAAAIRAKEVEDLNRELKEMRALVEELHSALRAEQAENSNLQAKVVALEREVEGMDIVRRRWLREDASNRSRGSNLERRLAGNTGNLRTFLFGADAKPTATRVMTPEESLPATTGSIRSSVSRSLVSGRMHGGGGGGAATSERSSAGEEEDGDMALSTTTAEGNAVRRARETAELERSELRRRHEVETSAKQSRIEKLKLEKRKLEAERDGLKQAAESQAGLFKDGYAELKACLEEMKKMKEMKTYRSPPPLSSASGMTPSAEVDRRLSQETLPPKAHHRSLRRPSELAAVSDDIYTSQPAAEGRAGAVRGRRVDKSDGGGCRGPTSEARAKRGSSRRVVAQRGDCPRNEDEGDDGSISSSSAASEGSGTLWVRVMPTDENSSEEDLKPPRSRSPDGTTTPCRRREKLLRRYLGNVGGDGAESEASLGGSRSRTGAAKAQPKRSTQTDRANSLAAARGIDAAGTASGSSRSPSPDSSGDGERTSDQFGPGGRLHNDSDIKRPGIKQENVLRGVLVTGLAAAETETATSGSGVVDRDSAAGARPRLLEHAEDKGPEEPLSLSLSLSRAKSGEEGEGEGKERAERGTVWAGGGFSLSIAAARERG